MGVIKEAMQVEFVGQRQSSYKSEAKSDFFVDEIRVSTVHCELFVNRNLTSKHPL